MERAGSVVATGVWCDISGFWLQRYTLYRKSEGLADALFNFSKISVAQPAGLVADKSGGKGSEL